MAILGWFPIETASSEAEKQMGGGRNAVGRAAYADFRKSKSFAAEAARLLFL